MLWLDAMSRPPFVSVPEEARPANVSPDIVIGDGDASVLFLTIEDATESDEFFRAACRVASGEDYTLWPHHDVDFKSVTALRKILGGDNELQVGPDGRLRIHNGQHSKIVPPDSTWKNLFKAYHSPALVGHRAHQRSLETLADRFVWPNMAKSVKKWAEGCVECQRAKGGTRADTVMVPLEVVPPWQRVAMDLMEFTNESARGHHWLLVLRDSGSRFTHAEALFGKTAAEVGEKLIDIFGIYGIPLEILTDEGTEFCNNIVKQLFEKLGIVHSIAAPHAHQSVGLVERANRDVRQYMRIFDTGNDWDLYVRPMMHAFNAAYCVPIERSPAELMFGRHFMYPTDFQLLAHSQSFLNVDEWERNLDDMLKKSATSDSATKVKMKERFESQPGKGRDKDILVEGDLVWYDPEDRSAGWKNRPIWQGPFKVLSSFREGQRVTIAFDGKTVTRGGKYFKKFRDGDESQPEFPVETTPTESEDDVEPKKFDGIQEANAIEWNESHGDIVGLSESDNEVVVNPPRYGPTHKKRLEPEEIRKSSTGSAVGVTPEGSNTFDLAADLLPAEQVENHNMKKSKTTLVPKVQALEYPKDFVVDDVLAVRDVGNARHFRIRWEGYSSEYNSWEPAACLSTETVEEAKMKWPNLVSAKSISYLVDAKEIDRVTNIQYVRGKEKKSKRRVFYVELKNDNWATDLKVAIDLDFLTFAQRPGPRP